MAIYCTNSASHGLVGLGRLSNGCTKYLIIFLKIGVMFIWGTCTCYEFYISDPCWQ